MHIDWAREIRDACQKQKVPFFFKQWGGLRPKAGGRLLDEREWNGWPARKIA
jgi:protein gp37